MCMYAWPYADRDVKHSEYVTQIYTTVDSMDTRERVNGGTR